MSTVKPVRKSFVADVGSAVVKTVITTRAPNTKPHMTFGVLELTSASAYETTDNGGYYIPAESVTLSNLEYIRALHAHLQEVIEYADTVEAAEQTRDALDDK